MKRVFLSLLLALLVASPALASVVLDDSVPQYAQVDTTPAVTAAPMSISLWIKTDDDTVKQTAVFMGDKDSDTQYFLIDASMAETDNPARAASRDAVTENSSAKTGLSTGTWFHIVGVYASADSRLVYINASAGTENTANDVPAGLDRIGIGRRTRLNPDQPFSGKIAEVCIYDIALTQTDIDNLYNGGSGTPCTNVQNADLVAYYKLIDDFVDSVAAANLTGSGSPTFDSGDHPVTHTAPKVQVQVIVVD